MLRIFTTQSPKIFCHLAVGQPHLLRFHARRVRITDDGTNM
jgi:hypothetical protein